MAYFKEVDPFGNASYVYESSVALDDSHVEIGREEYIDTLFELSELNLDLIGDRDRGGPAI